MADVLTSIGVVLGGVAAGAIAAPVAVLLFGFGTGGVVAGSLAAGTHATIGNVTAGSIFAFMQSMGTMPLLSGLYGSIAGGLVGAVGAIFV
ncbi:SubName: Full=Uncharacterized protein {ECO:0000313/EMBL:CCA67739.1} [Serendipita indica DSM 11827]|uniref:Uncharacterized protein n=1 Tax=Serendipita indica (strain DSM 11827) TaxID=1109443 RepID=G4T8X4_SERID|nr:SubName: Full=Uncharacterized protein {ECO:0000313/EMBL:CCA67739.1} [Serendipita indica DSM 11827]CCA67739.1 hypothetical protein PIIN_01566 [Serendipita indica DSM 11827]